MPGTRSVGEQYHLHPLHIEDCRHRSQRAKVEEGADYLFVVLKPVNAESRMRTHPSAISISSRPRLPASPSRRPSARRVSERFDKLKSGTRRPPMRADQLFYRIMDALVDTYLPILDR